MYLIVYVHRGLKHLKFKFIVVEVETYCGTRAYSSYHNRMQLVIQAQKR